MEVEFSADWIKKVPSFLQNFHLEIQDQHNQLYLYNRQHNFKALCDQDRHIYRPLNDANLSLGRFCKRFIEQVKQELGADYHNVANLEDLVLEWQVLYNRGGTFDTFRIVEKVILGLKDITGDIENSREMDEVKSMFITIPYLSKVFFQFSIIIPAFDTKTFLEELFSLFHSNPYLSYYFKQVMIYKGLHQMVTVDGENIACRIIKVSMLPDIINSKRNPVLREFTEKLSSLRYKCTPIHGSSTMFAERVSDCVFLSQGNLNYKRFLKLLGIIDKVYSEEHDYAYLNSQ